MKKITNILLVTFVLTNFAVTSAKASEPTGTYAVVNSSGVVTDIIVCAASVCGLGGAWGGVMPSSTPCPGCSLVLQVPPNPVTNQSQGGNMGTPENPVRYDAQAQVFTQGSASAPAPITRSETVDTTTLTATIHSDVVTFGPNNFIDGQMQLTPRVESTTAATITAIQSNSETRTVTTESFTFATPQTVEQIRSSLAEQLVMLRTHLNKLIELLNGWVKD